MYRPSGANVSHVGAPFGTTMLDVVTPHVVSKDVRLPRVGSSTYPVLPSGEITIPPSAGETEPMVTGPPGCTGGAQGDRPHYQPLSGPSHRARSSLSHHQATRS